MAQISIHSFNRVGLALVRYGGVSTPVAESSVRVERVTEIALRLRRGVDDRLQQLWRALETDLISNDAARQAIHYSYDVGLLFLVETKVNSSSTSSVWAC